MKLFKKQSTTHAEFFYLPKKNDIGSHAEWVKVPEGLLLKYKRR